MKNVSFASVKEVLNADKKVEVKGQEGSLFNVRMYESKEEIVKQ